jgi:hypothetical protein
MTPARAPAARRVLVWCVLTWVSSTVGVVVSVWAGNWAAVLYATNAAVLAAGWYLACWRWAEWQAVAWQALRAAERRSQ